MVLSLEQALEGLSASDRTGILVVKAQEPVSSLFFHRGDLVACCTDWDDEELERILLSWQLVGMDQMDTLRPKLDEGWDLSDVLLGHDMVAFEDLVEARSALFNDNLAWTLATPGTACRFEPAEAVFPSNIQFGIQVVELLSQCQDWMARVASVIEALGGVEDLFSVQGSRPDDYPQEAWAELLKPRPMYEILDYVGAPRAEAALLVAEWLDASLLVPSNGAIRPGGAAVTARSYDVLDKVDLTGIDILGVGGEDSEPTGPAISVVEVAAGDASEPLEMGEVVDEDAPIEVEGDGPSLVSLSFWGDTGELCTEDAPPIQFAGAGAGAEGEDDEAVITADDLGPPPEASQVLDPAEYEGRFDQDKLDELVVKVDTFNDLYRILFGHFATQLSATENRKRFNELLWSPDRQNTVLFQGLEVGGDGAISPRSIVGNLAAMGPKGDPTDVLHRALYDLLFAHLYDAKEILPSDVEAAMMEDIVENKGELDLI